MIKLVAFDWNGTIFDDIEGGTRAESATRAHFGFKNTTAEEIRKHFIIPIRKYWINAGLSEEFFDKHSGEIDAEFMKNYEPEEAVSPIRKNTKEILDWLESQNIQSVIASNHIVPHIEKQTTRFGIRRYFKAILARDVFGDITHHKRTFKDELLAKYVEDNQLNPQEVIIVGDTTEEIEIGRKLGYFTISITNGWQSEDRLKAAAPDYLIHDLIELKDIIATI